MTRDASLIAVEMWSKSHAEDLSSLFDTNWPASIFIFRKRAVESWRPEIFHSILPHIVQDWLKYKSNQKKLLKKGKECFLIFKKLLQIKNKKTIGSRDFSRASELFSKGLVSFIALYWVYEWNEQLGTKVPINILKLGKRARENTALFDDGNEIIFRYLKTLATQNKWPKESEKFLLRSELEKIKTNRPAIFPRAKANQRQKGYFYYHSKLRLIKELPNFLKNNNFILLHEKIPHKRFVRGLSAHRGVVKGTARIVYYREEINKVKNNDILIAPMTTPWYLPAMKRAAGFITDEGGLISHAAIIARELKKPCLVGTRVATKIFKDGDLVRLDAKRGYCVKIK